MPRSLALLTLLPTLALAQTQTFDVFSLTPPPGWKKDVKSNSVVYSTSDTRTGEWSQLALFGSTGTHGSLAQDLDTDWKELVATSFPGVGDPSREEGAASGGWQSKTAAATFTFNGKQGTAKLYTFGNGPRAASVLTTANGRQFSAAIAQSLSTLRLASGNPPPTPAPATTPVNSAFTFTTTTFDDGWVATEASEGVLLRKGPLTGLLHFRVAYTDATRNLDDQARVLHFWNQLVSPRYRVPKVSVRRAEPGVGTFYFGEGDGTDAAGNPVHVALLIASQNGNAECIEVAAPDARQFAAAFPTLEQLHALAGRNKFDVPAKDLPGTWTDASSAWGQYVYSSTGASAGMQGASTSDTFVFRPNGSYHYEYSGVSGMAGGSLSAHTEKKDGTFTAGSWQFSTTDSQGKTTRYSAQFELVRSGRVLHLQNVQFSGMQLHLARKP